MHANPSQGVNRPRGPNNGLPAAAPVVRLPRSRRRSPRPPAAPGARCTRRSAPLSRSAVLSWVNRIKRVREYVPRPVRHPGATTLCGAGSLAALSVAWPMARFAGKAASAATGGSNRENRGARNPMQRRCTDRLVSQFRRVNQFRDHPPGGFMGKREPQIIPTMDERDIRPEIGREGNYPPNQYVSMKPGFPRGRQARGRLGQWSLGADRPAPKARRRRRTGAAQLPARE
jgi:hypothetical protein